MKKKAGLEGDQQLEILKAVAQAWHSHSEKPLPTTEFEASRRTFIGRPSRFKLEAMKKTPTADGTAVKWDFRQSLWDSYEIVRVFERLEAGLVPGDDPFDYLQTRRLASHRRRERQFSLRYLFDQSSRRFNEIQSLWDSYEIVRVFKKLEAGSVPEDDPFDDLQTRILARHRRWERRSSLRYLFDQSSRRFNEIQVRQKTAGLY